MWVDLFFFTVVAEGASDTQRTVRGDNIINKNEEQPDGILGDTQEHHVKPTHYWK